METLGATVDSDSLPLQNKVWWKVKHKLEELKMAKSRKRRSPYVKIRVHYVAWSWCQVCLYKFTLQTTGRWKLLLHSRLFNDQNCSLQGLGCHRNDMTNAWPDDDSGQMLTSLKIPLASSIGAVLLLLLPLLVILHHVQQIDVSTNQPETGMSLLM